VFSKKGKKTQATHLLINRESTNGSCYEQAF